jgi:adenosine deaminase
MIELHAHLGSLTTPRNLWRIMNRLGINVGVKDYYDFVDIIYDVEKHNYELYLKKFELTHKIQSNPSAIEECVYFAVEDAYMDHGLSGIEIRFNPMLRNLDGNFNLDDTILHACIGLQKALHAFPIKAGIIISTDKSFSEKQHMILLEKAMKYKTLGVIGIDCSGNSTSIEDIKRLIPMYKECQGIGKTVHAGETYNMIDEISIAVDELGVNRIGHGIQASRVDHLMDKIISNNICLEICPVSNLTTGIFKNNMTFIETVSNMHRRGVEITYNTDGNIFLKTNMKDQFKLSFDVEERIPDINLIYETFKQNSFKHTFL